MPTLRDASASLQALPEPTTLPTEPVASEKKEPVQPPPQPQPAEAAPDGYEDEEVAMEEDAAPDAVAAPVDMPSQPPENLAAPQHAPVEAAQPEAEAPEQPSTILPPSEPIQPDVVVEAATPVSLALPKVASATATAIAMPLQRLNCTHSSEYTARAIWLSPCAAGWALLSLCTFEPSVDRRCVTGYPRL